MKIAVDINTRAIKWYAPSANPRFPEINPIEFTLRDNIPIRIGFISNNVDVTGSIIPANSDLKVGIKRAQNFEGPFLAFSEDSDFVAGTSTEPAFFRVNLNLNTVELFNYFSESVLNDPEVSAIFEICWGDSLILTSTKAVPCNIYRDVIQGTEGTPQDSVDLKATQAEAEAGTNNDRWMTPLRVSQAFGALGAFSVFNAPTYIIPEISNSATSNGASLRAAYASAKLLTPNSLPLSPTNRATVLLLPGRYDLATTPLTMDTEFVDLVGLSEEPKHVFITSQVSVSNSGTIVQTADNVVIRNVSIDLAGAPAGSGAGRTAAYFPNRTSTAIQSWASNGALVTVTSNEHGLLQGDSIRITDSGNSSFDGVYTVYNVIDLNSFQFISTVNSSGLTGTVTERFDDTYIENCRFSGTSDSGMRWSIEYAGTYSKCVGGNRSWGFGSFVGNEIVRSIASGTFTNCTAGGLSFAHLGEASGTFTNCTGGNASYGYMVSASGTFTNCTGGDHSFASQGWASGVFIECSVTYIDSYLGLFTGTMNRCRFVTIGTNTSPLRVGEGAKIFDSTLIATGTGNSIRADTPVTISLAGCRMNRPVDNNISNNLGTLTESYNLVDSDIT